MHVIGIVAEFNPFHKGHEYIIQKAREAVGDPRAVVMCIMSGPFTQRGLPAVMPKDLRARQALLCGADVILELPFVYACAPSADFARGAVESLLGTGVLTDIAFGVDCEDPALLEELASAGFESDDRYSALLKEGLASGLNFPTAREEAIIAISAKEEYRSVLKSPNSILALEYLKAIKSLDKKKRINIHMIKRSGEAYSSEKVEDGVFASAAGIRKLISSCSSKAELALRLKDTMPPASLAVMLASEIPFPDLKLYERMAFIRALTSTSEEIGAYAYMGDSLPGLIKNTAEDLRSGEAFFDKINTKHFVSSRIMRAVAALMTGRSDERYIKPRYIRVLGFNREGRYCLKIMGKCSSLPIFHNDSDALELYSSDPDLKAQHTMDVRACELYALLTGQENGSFRQVSPVITK